MFQKKFFVCLAILSILILGYITLSANGDYWLNKLSEDEKEIFNLINKQRSEKKIKTLTMNARLSYAIKEEIKKIIESKSSKDTLEIEKAIKDFMSNFGEKVYVVKGTSNAEILAQLKKKLENEILNESNRCLVMGMGKPKNGVGYLSAYLPRYFIQYGLSRAISASFPDGVPSNKTHKVTFDSLEITGKTNGKYLKFVFYRGETLPFYYTGKEIITEEIETKEDGNFSVTLPVGKFGEEKKRIAVYSKNEKEEPYSLIDFFGTEAQF